MFQFFWICSRFSRTKQNQKNIHIKCQALDINSIVDYSRQDRINKMFQNTWLIYLKEVLRKNVTSTGFCDYFDDIKVAGKLIWLNILVSVLSFSLRKASRVCMWQPSPYLSQTSVQNRPIVFVLEEVCPNGNVGNSICEQIEWFFNLTS